MMGRQTGGQDKLFYSFNLEDHMPVALHCYTIARNLLRGV